MILARNHGVNDGGDEDPTMVEITQSNPRWSHQGTVQFDNIKKGKRADLIGLSLLIFVESTMNVTCIRN
jgi:hypothetical protein